MTLRDVRASLVQRSRHYGRVQSEVEDLAHDVLVSALRRGLPLELLSLHQDGQLPR